MLCYDGTMGTVIGYARVASTQVVSTGAASNGSSLEEQKAALLQAGCERVFEEMCSGALPFSEREGLLEILGKLQPGDTLIACDIARLSRSLPCLMMILSDLHKRGVGLHVLSPSRELADLDQMLNPTLREFAALRG